MPIIKPAHYSIRTPDLEASIRFYTEVLQFRVGFRPPFKFPGAWLYPGQDESEFGAVHLIGVDSASHQTLIDYFGDRHVWDDVQGSGAVDHLAFTATDWPNTRQRYDALGVDYREQRVPSLNLLQVFLVDPSGVMIELNYLGHDADLPKKEFA